MPASRVWGGGGGRGIDEGGGEEALLRPCVRLHQSQQRRPKLTTTTPTLPTPRTAQQHYSQDTAFRNHHHARSGSAQERGRFRRRHASSGSPRNDWRGECCVDYRKREYVSCIVCSVALLVKSL